MVNFFVLLVELFFDFVNVLCLEMNGVFYNGFLGLMCLIWWCWGKLGSVYLSWKWGLEVKLFDCMWLKSGWKGNLEMEVGGVGDVVSSVEE